MPPPTGSALPADPAAVAAAVRRGEMRPLARSLSWLEAGDPRGPRVLAELRRTHPDVSGRAGTRAASDRPRLIGITGSPGSGKSTLVDAMVARYRADGRRVAVLAVDPSSPYSGGAILGDRIRMTRWHDDPGVFVRSMATRGRLGGLAAATLRAAALLEAAGFDRVLIETVGVGQSEVDVVEVADSTVLVVTPGGGDGVQAFKAGVMEIADAFVVNKADLPGADRVRREIRAAQGLALSEEGAWTPPVVLAEAPRGTGVEELLAVLDDHHRWTTERGEDAARGTRLAAAELAAAVRARADGALRAHAAAYLPTLAVGRATAEEVADAILAAWSEGGPDGDPGGDTVGSEP